MAFIPMMPIPQPTVGDVQNTVKLLVNRNGVLSDLAEVTSRLGQKRLEEGNEVAARELFKESARIYAHVSTKISEAEGKRIVLEKALNGALRSDDHKLTYDIAIGALRVSNSDEYDPKFRLADEILEDSRVVAGVRKILEKTGYNSAIYYYRINMDQDEFDKLVLLSEGTKRLNNLLKHPDTQKTGSYIKESDDSAGGIRVRYNSLGFMTLSSRHSTVEHEGVKELINSVAVTLELLVRS